MSRPTKTPRPFSARSLVGMTMGARKRAAWYQALRSSYDGNGGPISNRELRLSLTTLSPAVLAVTVPREWRRQIRAKYRIGQRLRPCPGCCECQGCYGSKKCSVLCDGSGVLPARKATE